MAEMRRFSPDGDPYLPLGQNDSDQDTIVRSSKADRVRRQHCCCNTQGRSFNLIVALVLFVNAIVIGFDADLGLLGMQNPVHAYRTVGTDASLLGATQSQGSVIQSNVKKGIATDLAFEAKTKQDLQNKLRPTSFSEINLEKGAPEHKSAAYTVCEYIFALFFTLEWLVRLCDLGHSRFVMDMWNHFDGILVVLGLFDVLLPLVLPLNSVPVLAGLAALRIARVLRILRFVRLLRELSFVGHAFVAACIAVIRVCLLVLLLNYMLAALLTAAVGQQAYLWEEHADQVELWFGSMGRSLQTLFSVMTLSGWTQMADVLGTVVPAFVVVAAVVLYIMICSFATCSLITGVVGSFVLGAHRKENQYLARQSLDQRVAFGEAVARILSRSTESQKGYLSWEELSKVMEQNPSVLAGLAGLDPALGERAAQEERLTQIFDRLAAEPVNCAPAPAAPHLPAENGGTGASAAGPDATSLGNSATASVRVGVDSIVEALAATGGAGAEAASLFEMKYLVLAFRREAAEYAKMARQEAVLATAELRQEVGALAAAVSGQVADLRQELAAARQLQGEAAAMHTAQIAALQREAREQASATGCAREEVVSVVRKLDALEKRIRQAQASGEASNDAVLAGIECLGRKIQASAEERHSAALRKANELLATHQQFGTRLADQLSERLIASQGALPAKHCGYDEANTKTEDHAHTAGELKDDSVAAGKLPTSPSVAGKCGGGTGDMAEGEVAADSARKGSIASGDTHAPDVL